MNPFAAIRWRALTLCMVAVIGCDDAGPVRPEVSPRIDDNVHQADYELAQLELADVPWYRWWMDSDADLSRDEDGVPIEQWNGGWHYHPINIAQRGLAYVEMYRNSGDPELLDQAEAFARRLILEADPHRGALYFPYTFDFDLHGIPGETMEAPWYSGLAQSQVVSLLLRLEAITGDTAYAGAAERGARSLLLVANGTGAYTTRIDQDGYYWIDEYPMPEPAGTLNGFMSGVVGAYEYWLVSGDDEYERVVQASLATLKEHIGEYRVPGGISYYDLKYRAQYEAYHWIHIELLRYMALISGDPFFSEMADLFVSDVSQ